MRKHLYIFIILFLAGTTGLVLFGKGIHANYENAIVSWDISGDESLFNNLEFTFDVSGGSGNDYWNVSTCPRNDSVCDSYYSVNGIGDLEKMLELNANINHYTSVKVHEELYDYKSCYISWEGSKQKIGGMSAPANFYKSYIYEAVEKDAYELQGEELPLDKVTENLIIELELDEETSRIVIPTPENIMVTPQVSYCYSYTKDSEKIDYFEQAIKENGNWDGRLLGLDDYRLDIVQGNINNEEYMAISFFNVKEPKASNSFTYIYQLTNERGMILLDEPRLIKSYDSYYPIEYIGASNGTAFILMEADNTVKISTIDTESFEVERTYLKALNNYDGFYKELGICNVYDYSYRQQDISNTADILHFDSDKLYIASYLYGGDVNESFVEILVLEPENAKPLATGTMHCNLFKLKANATYSLNEIVNENKYCVYNLRIKKVFE